MKQYGWGYGLLGLLLLPMGVFSQNVSKKPRQYIGNDTVKIEPLKTSVLYASVWNRLRLRSKIWITDFNPLVSASGATIRKDESDPNVLWIKPDSTVRYVHLIISRKEGNTPPQLLMDVALKVKPLPLPSVRIFINDSIDYYTQISRYWKKVKWRNNNPDKNLQLPIAFPTLAYFKPQKLTFRLVYPPRLLKLCPDLQKENSFQIQSVQLWQRGCHGREPVHHFYSQDTASGVECWLSQYVLESPYPLIFEITKITRRDRTGQIQDVTNLFPILERSWMTNLRR